MNAGHRRRRDRHGRPGRARSSTGATWSSRTAGSSRSAPGRRRRSTGPSASTARGVCSPRAWSTPTTTSTSGRPAGTPPTARCSSGSPSSTRSGRASPSRWSGRPPRPAWPGWPGRAAPRRPTTTTCSRAAAATCSAATVEAAARGRSAVPPDPRLDGPRPVRRAACRRTRWSSASTRSWPPAQDAVRRFHDPSPDAMVRVALAPCSPFSVTAGSAAASRRSWPAISAYGCTHTWPRPWTRRSSAGTGSAARRWSTWTGSAGSATTCGWPTPSTWPVGHRPAR